MVEENEKMYNKGAWWAQGVKMFTDVSTWIIVPIVLALIAGKYLDDKFSTAPTMLLILASASFLLSIYGIVKTVKKYTNKLKNDK